VKVKNPTAPAVKREAEWWIGGDGSAQTAKILKPREKSGSGK